MTLYARLADLSAGATIGVESALSPRLSVERALARAQERLGGEAESVPLSPDNITNLSGEGGVISTMVLWAPPWDHRALVELREQLGSRRLIAVEPVSALGLRRAGQRLATPLLRRRFGLDFNRDLPRELRLAGFAIEAADRFTAGTLSIETYAYLELRPHLISSR